MDRAAPLPEWGPGVEGPETGVTAGRGCTPAIRPGRRRPGDDLDLRPAEAGRGFASAVIDEQADFDALAAAWDDLWARTPSATPFQTHAWTSAWARAYVRPGQLAVATVWDDDVLVAAAALHRIRRGPVRLLAPLGGEITDHVDVLLDPHVADAGARLTEALLRLPGWRVLDLPEVLPGAAVHSWARGWPGRVTRAAASVNLGLPALPVAEALARVPARTAGTLRRKLRRIDGQGIEVTAVAAADVPRAVGDLIRLHADQWAGRRGNPEHLTDRFRDHLTGALPAMIERRQALLVEYRLGGELVAAEVDLVGHDQLAYYLAGISPALRERIDTAVLLVSKALERATRLEKREYSFLRGDEDYKLRWRPDEVPATRILLGRPGPLGALGYFAAAGARRTLFTVARRTLRGPAYELARSAMHLVRIRRARG